MSSISSDLYEETLKPNESHTNRIIQIVSCKTALRICRDVFRQGYAETCSEPSQTSKMELFAKLVNDMFLTYVY